MSRLGISFPRYVVMVSVLLLVPACGPTYMESMSVFVEEFHLAADPSLELADAFTETQKAVVQAALADRHYELRSFRIRGSRKRVVNDSTKLESQPATSSRIGLPEFTSMNSVGIGAQHLDGNEGLISHRIDTLPDDLGSANITVRFPQTPVQQAIDALKLTSGYSQWITIDVSVSAQADGEPFEFSTRQQARVWKHEYIAH